MISKSESKNGSSDQRLERPEGCLLGLACGDAVGTTVEFRQRGRFPPLTDMIGGGKFRLRKGEWTDDTAMTLCLADSLLARNGFDALDQMQRYLRWAEDGYNSCRDYAFGIGKTVVSALIRFGETSDPYSGSTDPRSSGNGSLMRLAPIPLFYADCHADAMIFAALSSKTTHASKDCIACCQYFAHTLLNALSGEQDKARLFPTPADLVFTPSMAHVENQAFKDKSADDVAGTGYVVESLEAAIWAFWHTTNYRDAILAAANLGDDADTTAAICGQLAGAYYGAEAMPGNWTSSLHKADEIRSTARRLVLHN